jgi:cephalosporin hydroxylase
MRNTLSQIYSKLYYSSILHANSHDLQNCDKGSLHSYIDHYEKLFAPMRDTTVRLLEIGVQGGISVLMWREYFSKSDVTGIDVDYGMLQPKVSTAASSDPNIHLIRADAALPSVVDHLSGKYDIVIDDGSHHFAHQIASFFILEPHLSDGAIYVIEDIQNEREAAMLNKLIPGSEIVDLRQTKNRYDDLILVYKKP